MRAECAREAGANFVADHGAQVLGVTGQLGIQHAELMAHLKAGGVDRLLGFADVLVDGRGGVEKRVHLAARIRRVVTTTAVGINGVAHSAAAARTAAAADDDDRRCD